MFISAVLSCDMVRSKKKARSLELISVCGEVAAVSDLIRSELASHTPLSQVTLLPPPPAGMVQLSDYS